VDVPKCESVCRSKWPAYLRCWLGDRLKASEKEVMTGRFQGPSLFDGEDAAEDSDEGASDSEINNAFVLALNDSRQVKYKGPASKGKLA
jgi:hypothetical protein